MQGQRCDDSTHQVSRLVLCDGGPCLSVVRPVRIMLITDVSIVKVSNVVLWSIIETGIAIIVGSIPSLKPLVKSIPFFGSHHSQPDRKSLNPLDDYQSFALRSMSRHGHHKTHISGKASKDLEEDDSMKDMLTDDPDIILVRSEVQVEEGARPATGYKSFKSFTF